jgi:hypothetical protein
MIWKILALSLVRLRFAASIFLSRNGVAGQIASVTLFPGTDTVPQRSRCICM